MTTDPFDLSTYLEEGREQADLALARAAEKLEDRLGTDVDPTVSAAALHGVSGGGKRLRPILCVAAYRACGGKASDGAIHDHASSIEMVHASSLMHDDLPCMDDAELRRGAAVTHLVHGEEATMRAGAVLIPWAILYALESSAQLECGVDGGLRSAWELSKAAGAPGMVGGQWLDLLAENEILDIKELDDLHRRKTGALLAVSPEMGARAAEAPTVHVEALRKFGLALGLAFQIVDDILDATSDAQTLGKEPSDAQLGKSTYVSHWGIEPARARARAEAERAILALDLVGLDVPVLRALARHVVNRHK